MNKALPWIIVVLIAVLVLLVLALLPTRRAGEVPPTIVPTPLLSTPSFPSPSPSPSPVVLTPEQQELADLQTETEALPSDTDLTQDLQVIDAELQGV